MIRHAVPNSIHATHQIPFWTFHCNYSCQLALPDSLDGHGLALCDVAVEQQDKLRGAGWQAAGKCTAHLSRELARKRTGSITFHNLKMRDVLG